MYYYDTRPLVGCLLLLLVGMCGAGCAAGMLIAKLW
jgi:hypothetical protein